jgi:ATP-dependent Lhr-like helicase
VIPTNAAPIAFYIRESADWLPHALAQQSVDESLLAAALSPEALRIRTLLQQRGACFANDLQRVTGLTRPQTHHALWELATAGLASADGFDQLRALMDPRRKADAKDAPSKRATRTTAGRWSLLTEDQAADPGANPIATARRTDAAIESFARMLLARYGILFRDLLARESNAPKWRELLGILRRLEARGEVRGGRFVTGFSGEQFALPEAAESLRAGRNRESSDLVSVAAADPMNLIGTVIPGDRISAIPGKFVRYRNGCQAAEDIAAPANDDAPPKAPRRSQPPVSGIPAAAMSPALRLF